MKEFLLDTHIWFWYLTGSERLPAGLRQKIDASKERCRISPISVWELAMLGERRWIELQPNIRGWIEQAIEQFPIREAPLNVEIALKSREIELPHQDPADRFLAATALIYRMTLLTVDARLTDADWLQTISE